MKRESVQRANARLRRELGKLHARVDKRHAEPHESGLKPSCSRGCSACCRQIVLAELAEAEYIVARNPDAIRRALPKLREHVAILRGTPGELRTEDGEKRFARVYWKLNIPCALLDERGECSVYADRPIACRTWFVADDPAKCAAEDPTDVLVLDYGTRGPAAETTIRLVSHIRGKGLSKDAGVPVLMGSLPQLLIHVIEGRGVDHVDDGIHEVGAVRLD